MKTRRARAAGCVAAAAVLIGGLNAGPAGAHQSPPGCDSNSLVLTVNKDRTLVRPGDRVNYTVTVSNNEGSACDLTDVTATLTLPGRDGRPTGSSVTLDDGADYLAGMGTKLLGIVPWTVDLNPGVTDAVVQARASGVLHDAPTDHAAEITKTLGTTVTQPHLTITETANPPSGNAPLGVTYTYLVVNDSSTPAPITNVTVSDDKCATVTYTGGDANSNGVLDNGEGWTYTCGEVRTTPGTVVSTAVATGYNQVEKVSPTDLGRPVNSAPTTVSVNVAVPSRTEVRRTQLPPPRSEQARPDASCLALVRRVRLRAREINIVRVRVADAGAGVPRALVRVTGAGLRKRAVTGPNGTVVFRLRPKRAGTLVIQTNHCAGADRVTVRNARKIISRQVPRVTG
jgi:uncharacterized repeat protein (TIGR01451 family)